MPSFPYSLQLSIVFTQAFFPLRPNPYPLKIWCVHEFIHFPLWSENYGSEHSPQDFDP